MKPLIGTVLVMLALSGCSSGKSCDSLVGAWRVHKLHEDPNTNAHVPYGAITISKTSSFSELKVGDELSFSSQGAVQSAVLDYVVNYRIESDTILVLMSDWGSMLVQDGIGTDGSLEALGIRRINCNTIQLCRFEANGTTPWLDLARL